MTLAAGKSSPETRVEAVQVLSPMTNRMIRFRLEFTARSNSNHRVTVILVFRVTTFCRDAKSRRMLYRIAKCAFRWPDNWLSRVQHQMSDGIHVLKVGVEASRRRH